MTFEWNADEADILDQQEQIVAEDDTDEDERISGNDDDDTIVSKGDSADMQEQQTPIPESEDDYPQAE